MGLVMRSPRGVQTRSFCSATYLVTFFIICSNNSNTHMDIKYCTWGIIKSKFKIDMKGFAPEASSNAIANQLLQRKGCSYGPGHHWVLNLCTYSTWTSRMETKLIVSSLWKSINTWSTMITMMIRMLRHLTKKYSVIYEQRACSLLSSSVILTAMLEKSHCRYQIFMWWKDKA